MLSRIRLRPGQLRLRSTAYTHRSIQRCRWSSAVTTAAAVAVSSISPADHIIQSSSSSSQAPQYYHPKQPPSHRRPEFRKSQLHRQYTSLLRSTPLALIFQHNNLTATEWLAIRRELSESMHKVDAVESTGYADMVKIHVVKTGIFAAALRVVEFFHPLEQQQQQQHHSSTSSTSVESPMFSHYLSTTAHEAARASGLIHGLEELMSGPLAILTIPSVSPTHLKAALSIVSPSPGFPAPRRRTNPSYYEPAVQNGLPKLLLLGARIEGKVFDTEGTRWVGSIPGGLDGLRAQLVNMLQGVGAGVTNTLETTGRSLYFTMEGRKGMLETDESTDGA